MLMRTTNVENMLASQAMCAQWYGSDRTGFRACVYVSGGIRITLGSHKALVTFLRDLVIENPSHKVSVDTWMAH